MPPITYNRTAKTYDLTLSGHAISFPKKDLAEQFLLAFSNRPIYDDTRTLATNFPALASRAWKAAWLHVGRAVHEDAGGYWVNSQGNTATAYHIPPDLTSCTCPDEAAPLGPGNRHYCKHILAVTLFRRHPYVPPSRDYANTIADFLTATGRP